MRGMAFLRPQLLEEALAAMAGGAMMPLAGGTDFYPARPVPRADEDVLDLSAIKSLRGIHLAGDALRIGALATWTDLREAALPPLLAGLQQAAGAIGGRQVQNTGTLAGNLCNASPAADGVPCLMALDAVVELASPRLVRRLPVADFVLGNRRTARAADEILTAIEVPHAAQAGRSAFQKLGARKHLVISIVMVAASLRRDAQGRPNSLAIAVGAAGPRALRLPQAEAAALAGQPIEPGHLAPLAPIDDARGTAAYRMDAALVLVRRAVAEVLA